MKRELPAGAADAAVQRVWTDGELAEKRSKVKEVRSVQQRPHRSARPATLKLPARAVSSGARLLSVDANRGRACEGARHASPACARR